MPFEDSTQNPHTSNDTTTITTQPPAAEVEPPYSIFDGRQKALIVLTVSTAATCK